MGSIGGLLGTAGGAQGTGTKGPQMPNIQSPVTPGDISAAKTGTTNSLQSTNDLLGALKGQGGIQNQSDVYGQGQGMYGQLSGLGGPQIMGTAAGRQDTFNTGASGLGGFDTQKAATGGQKNLLGQLGGLGGTDTMGQAMGRTGTLGGQISGLGGTGMIGAAAGSQGNLNTQLGGAGGVGMQTDAASGLKNVLAGQQGTAAQYQNIANGTGPNPAQAALNQSTGQNVANQAALMAGQRGAGANVGLLARQAAQQGAATQQQAVGQGATLQANQQIAGLQGMAGVQRDMGQTNLGLGNVGSGLVNQTQTGINALGGLGTSTVGLEQRNNEQQFGQGAGVVDKTQTGINALSGQGISASGQEQGGINAQFGQGQGITSSTQGQIGQNAGIAGGQVGNVITTTNNAVGGNLQNSGQVLGAGGNYNTNVVNATGNVNAADTAMGTTVAKGQQDLIGGVMQGAGAGASMAGGAAGGYVGMAAGGDPTAPVIAPEQPGTYEYAAPNGNGPLLKSAFGEQPIPPQGPQSAFGQFLAGTQSTGDFLTQYQTKPPEDTANKQQPAAPPDQGDSKLKKGASGLTKALMMGAAKGGAVERDFRSGGGVKATKPEEKATKPGNSYANDKVKALLSEGEVVIPRSVMESKDPARSAADFVAKVLAKRKKA